MREELGQKSIEIREKMITDLTTFINKLISENNEIILLIDTNEPLTPGSGIERPEYQHDRSNYSSTRMQKHTKHSPKRISTNRFDVYTDQINNFITIWAINPFNFFSSSDHQGSYLDIQLKTFLRNPFKPVILPSLRLLVTKKIYSVRIYKTRLLKYIT